MANPQPTNVVMGVFWMLMTGLFFVGVTAAVKVGGQELPAAESAFLRYVIGLVFLIPMIGALRRAKLDRQLLGIFALRGLFHTAGVTCWFFAMTRIPIAEVTAMNYLNPVYVTILAAFFLGEKLQMRRVMAIGMALVGALIILRPGFREISSGHIAMLFTALSFGVSYTLVKAATNRTSPLVVVAMLSITVTIGLAPLAIAVWVPPTLEQVLWMGVVAFLATAGHYTMTLAFAAAPLAVTQPVTFLQLIWAAFLGVVFFDEAIDAWVMLGGALILSAVSFITWREAVLKRRAVTPATMATKV